MNYCIKNDFYFNFSNALQLFKQLNCKFIMFLKLLRLYYIIIINQTTSLKSLKSVILCLEVVIKKKS